MKIVFLDFDGPIIPARAFLLCKTKLWDEPCPTSGSLVNELLKRSDARIVISSSWRRGGLEKCKEVLKKAGIDHFFIHDDWKTSTTCGGSREDEIDLWLKEHDGIESFIAIDDSNLEKLPKANFVHTTTRDGFLLDHFEEACEKLGTNPYDGIML